MRAAVIAENGRFEVRTLPDPEPNPNQLLVRVDACGVCGSDIHFRRAGMVRPGLVMGHEIGGTVEAVGADCDTGVRPGDAVAVMPCLPCGTCAHCVHGRPQLCSEMLPTTMGLGARPGGLAEYVAVWPAQVFPLPAGVPSAVGALAEPLAVGFHGVDLSGARPGDRVAVLGGGSIGVMTAYGLRAHGVDELVVTEPSAARLETLVKLGFDAVTPNQLFSHTRSPAVVFDTTGVGTVLAEACSLVRAGGKVMLMGVVEHPAELLPLMLVVKEVTVQGVLGYGETFPDAVAALGGGRVDTGVLAGSRAPLDATEDVFQALESADAPPKLLIEPWA